MAQDPLKPRDSGKLSLPQVDAAMNRVAPDELIPSDRGPSGLFKERGKKKKAEEILARARKRMDRSIDAESENRRDGLDDLRMKAGDQWPGSVVAQRNMDKRPCETVNKFPTFVHQITNELRLNRPSININPVGDRGDVEVAKMYRGWIRAIERDCAADIAYDTGADSAVSNGWGYWRILTEWESPNSFRQVVTIQRIRNPFTVYLDPMHQQPDGSDCKWGFITELLDRDDFESQWPNADPMPFSQAGMGETLKNWITKDQIRIAEYFEIQYDKQRLLELDNGWTGWEDDLSNDARTALDKGSLHIIDARESENPQVKWYKITAKEVLQSEDWPGRWIPIIKVIGDEVDIEGKVKLSGIIRHAKGPQRMYNYARTAEIEAVALAPKAVWVVAEGQLEGHEDEFQMANIRSLPYLSYKPTSLAGTMVPPPQRQGFAQVPAGIEAVIEGSAMDMMATTGIRFDATVNERMSDESGKAIRELRRTGDIGAFHYTDNMARSLRFTGQQLIDLLPKIYTTRQVITILRENEAEERVIVDPMLGKPYAETRDAEGKLQRLFNPTFGKYGVTVTIGPSYATKRIEASENMIQFARALPQTASLIADLIAKHQDWPGADEISRRLAAAVPPQLLQPEQKDLTPQIQALLAGMESQIKQLTQQLQGAMQELGSKDKDRAVDMEKIQRDFEAKLLTVIAGLESKMAAVEQKRESAGEAHIRGIAENVTKVMEILARPEPKQEGSSNERK